MSLNYVMIGSNDVVRSRAYFDAVLPLMGGVIIADYMSHPLSRAIYNLQTSGALKGEVILLNCHGKSGVLRDILQHVNRQKIAK
jgi:hypothetical protein